MCYTLKGKYKDMLEKVEKVGETCRAECDQFNLGIFGGEGDET